MRVRGALLPSRNGIGAGMEVGTPTSTIPLSDYGRKSMRVVVQRVSEARVRVDGEVVGEIGRGFLILLGVARDDEEATTAVLANKIAKLRVFPNEEGKFDRSVADVGGSALVVSQFTLLADTAKGNRPSFLDAMPPEDAERFMELFCFALSAHVPVETGRFGAKMAVELVNDGPVTIVLEA
jgi:D-tyrosyl-tRNA(Tyr) deacylase